MVVGSFPYVKNAMIENYIFSSSRVWCTNIVVFGFVKIVFDVFGLTYYAVVGKVSYNFNCLGVCFIVGTYQ